jgi:NAD(P)-dependent dehydrogenase (short-subunit alcohol dehydrogenase family)
VKLKNKIALVTGAGKGIGREIAKELAREGADVVLNYSRSATGAEEVAQTIRDEIGRTTLVVQADVSQIAQVEAMVEAVIKKFGKLDILVNNAGITYNLDFFEIREEDWDRILDVNLKGAFLCSQYAGRYMREQKGGKIIHIGSVHSRSSMPLFTPYAASKGGLDALTMQMALELAPYQINVNAIAPGLIEIEKNRQDPKYDRDHRARQIPRGRVGMPLDVAKAVVFFASEDSDFITGQVLFVDGGQLAKIAMVRDATQSVA